MAYTLDDLKHDTWRLLTEEVNELSRDERQALLERMDVEDRLRGWDAEERLQGLDHMLVEEWLRRTKH